ncbi:hypothetical protein PbB2_00352 [Candidatus Phycosocius bacilliformis]|uniref:DUF1501 domain-containing protein n=1 Tax=Candidatus Phycosocius bacilliformis TaxID=1445552 RepID=A0A2P2E6L0_9PROT|nr:DUF1501 domain-containing protein [Candidatus Phycosocius bacilliformis]GBF56695.1 hypothetical protein PbB2_00352 [Candidatus Phycosocius bacilliformis]
MTNRRTFLTAGLSGLTLAMAGARASFAQAPANSGKFVFIILRGAMDGLAAVAPYADPDYRALRGNLALAEPGSPDGCLPLTAGFGLHPNLQTLHGLWQERRMSFVHAAASPYRERSHFDAQDMLEAGTAQVTSGSTGWLNRALALLPASPDAEGVAIGRTIPLVLRGTGKATSWAPPLAPESDMDTLMRLGDLYAGDPMLATALAMAIETNQIADGAEAGMSGRNRVGAYASLASAAARILSAPGGPAAAVLSFEGWDTHANQGATRGQLATRLEALDQAVAALRTGLGPLWSQTTVVIATEFGRTVRVNGTGGTDHGTGGAAFLLGGAVQGGYMMGDWPGLNRLHEDRDLIPANDVRTVFAAGLAHAWRLDQAVVMAEVFNA